MAFLPNDQLSTTAKSSLAMCCKAFHQDADIYIVLDRFGAAAFRLIARGVRDHDEHLARELLDQFFPLISAELDILQAIDENDVGAFLAFQAGEHLVVLLLVRNDDLAFHFFHVLSAERILQALAMALLE